MSNMLHGIPFGIREYAQKSLPISPLEAIAYFGIYKQYLINGNLFMANFMRAMRMEDKRRGKRIMEENKLICEIISCDKIFKQKKIFCTLTKDISLGGVNIRTDTFLPVDTVVKMELSLSKMQKIVWLKGKVKWATSLYDDEVFEIGLEFVDTPPDIITSLIGHLYSTGRD